MRKCKLKWTVTISVLSFTLVTLSLTFTCKCDKNMETRISVSEYLKGRQVHNSLIGKSAPESLSVIPKVVYMFWDKGWDNVSDLVNICSKSFQRHNKDFEIKLLDLAKAEELIRRREVYSDSAWNFAKVQAKSDIIRVELLAKYGGVWADASVYCNEPLSNWLTDDLLRYNFFAYERRGGYVTKDTYPFISSWFLAASNDSVLIHTWRNAVREAWAEEPYPPKTLKYYWLHMLFRYLVKSNSTIRSLYESIRFYDAGGPHCNLPNYPTPHIYKLKSGSCWKERKNIYAKENVTNV